MTSEIAVSTRVRIVGIDSVRFVLALVVCLSHLGGPYIPLIEADRVSHPVARLLYHNLFVGPAAVIAFFIISGFCIHYGLRQAAELDLPAYFARRWIRTLVPLGAAYALWWVFRSHAYFGLDSVLWSLVCEEIYYLGYPLLLIARRRYSWRRILTVTFIAAVCVILTDPRASRYPAYGHSLNWLLGLPVWLLGCVLADRVATLPLPDVSRREIWSWRAAIWAVTVPSNIVRFHMGIGQPWTLTLMSGLMFLWLYREIAYAQGHGTSRWAEWAGAWSYSLYLLHPVLGGFIGGSDQVAGVTWGLRYAVVLGGSYLFYRVVENPAHHAARALSRWMTRRAAPARAVAPPA